MTFHIQATQPTNNYLLDFGKGLKNFERIGALAPKFEVNRC